jgi:lysophospholipase L1-like esterase
VIRLEFLPPASGTLDVVFQQQSFLTRGDPEGEELPVQRRLLRLSTRADVPAGLASGTHKTPSPFTRIDGGLLPGAANRLEVRSDDRGVDVLLNGRRTFVAGAKPLGYGETGLIAWDGPVQVTALSVEATAGQSLRDRLLPLAGLLAPFVAVGGVWAVLRTGGGVPLATAAALTLGGLVPLAIYLAGTLLIERNTLLLLHRERVGWLGLALLAASLTLPALVLFVRRRLRGAVLFFYLSCGAVAAAALGLAIERIAAAHPELLRRWIPADDVVVPGELVEQAQAGEGPWYGQDRMIGANNYVWRQLFGTRRVAAEKPAGVVRVFLMGGSQAWGSGAADSFSTFDQVLERRLRAQGLPVEVFNAGINGAGISRVRWTWDGLVSALSPDLLILDIGLNDSAGLAGSPNDAERRRRREALLAEFTAILDRARAVGADVLLVQEPMCQETPLRPDAAYYAGLSRIAGERGVAVLSPQAAFAHLERDHFVWWDTAHLTPYGHDALAGLLEAPAAALVRRRLP